MKGKTVYLVQNADEAKLVKGVVTTETNGKEGMTFAAKTERGTVIASWKRFHNTEWAGFNNPLQGGNFARSVSAKRQKNSAS